MSTQKTKKTKRPDKRPARARYWATNRLEKHKVRNLMTTGQFETVADARTYWRSVRKRHRNILGF